MQQEAHLRDFERPSVHPFAVGWIAGLVGGLVMTGLGALGRAAGLGNLDHELFLGRWAGVEAPDAWVAGFFIHLALSGLVGMVYAAGFRALGRAGMRTGILFGLAHWLVGGAVIALASPSGNQGPGLWALGLGPSGALAFLFLHLAYGASVGGLFRMPVDECVAHHDDPIATPAHFARHEGLGGDRAWPEPRRSNGGRGESGVA